MRVSVIGAGWVGKNIGVGMIELGHDVLFYDISGDTVKDLKNRGYEATMDLRDALENSEISFLCVPTPNTSGGIDLSHLKSAVEQIATTLSDVDNYRLLVVKSTVVPGTTENLVIPQLEGEGIEVGSDVGVCMNPEFLTEISDTWSDSENYDKGFFSEDRIVIGEYDRKSGEFLEKLYGSLDTPIIRTDLKTAEMIKYACNCALSTKISYWNEIFLICERLGIDSDLVAQTAAMDDRIGKYGTVHGKAFGGKCLPKDLRAFIDFVEGDTGEIPELLKAVEKVNKYMKKEYGVRE